MDEERHKKIRKKRERKKELKKMNVKNSQSLLRSRGMDEAPTKAHDDHSVGGAR